MVRIDAYMYICIYFLKIVRGHSLIWPEEDTRIYPSCVGNLLGLGDISMHWWTGSSLDQLMACHLFGSKPLSELMLPYCQLGPKEHISIRFIWNSEVFTQENAFENIICKMVAILSLPKYVNIKADNNPLVLRSGHQQTWYWPSLYAIFPTVYRRG